VAAESTLAEAHKLLQSARARHLPVVDGEQLVGVVSLTDLYFAERRGDARSLRVKEAMEKAVTVPSEAALDIVALRMAREKASAVVVVEGGKIAGIFTTVDALRALAAVTAPPARQRNPARSAGVQSPGRL
jgi:acetoin utilization protein AcuB